MQGMLSEEMMERKKHLAGNRKTQSLCVVPGMETAKLRVQMVPGMEAFELSLLLKISASFL